MSRNDAFERCLRSLHAVALDDTLWPDTACLIGEICRTEGNCLVLGKECHRPDTEFFFFQLWLRGHRREDMERDYLQNYLHRDESVPRIQWLPSGQLTHASDLYTDREKETSTAYNEAWREGKSQNGLLVVLDGLRGSRILWKLADCVDREGWTSEQIATITRLMPHVGQCMRVRQVLAEAGALNASLTHLLGNTRCGVIQLDRQGRITAANDRATRLLRQGEALVDARGFLRTCPPSQDRRLQRLLARAMPPFQAHGSAGSMTIGSPTGRTRLAMHIQPVANSDSDFRPQRVAALVLVVDPTSRTPVDPHLVEETLGLTPAQSRLAVMLAAGHSLRQIAADTGREEATLRWHLKQIFRRQGISRQSELVRRVSALDGFPSFRR